MATHHMGSLKTPHRENLSSNSSNSMTSDPQGPQASFVSKVRVIVRVRPFIPEEISRKNGNPISCVSVLDPELESPDEVRVHLKDQDSR